MNDQARTSKATKPRVPWNKGRVVGQKRPFKRPEIWAIGMHLEEAGRVRDLALFNLGIDSKLRGFDLVQLWVRDIYQAGKVLSRATVLQHKTGIPVQFELTKPTRKTVRAWNDHEGLQGSDYLFSTSQGASGHLSTTQYLHIVHDLATLTCLETQNYGTYSIRRTKATLVYGETKNTRAVQLLLGHRKLGSTYLGMEVDDALPLSEQVEI